MKSYANASVALEHCIRLVYTAQYTHLLMDDVSGTKEAGISEAPFLGTIQHPWTD